MINIAHNKYLFYNNTKEASDIVKDMKIIVGPSWSCQGSAETLTLSKCIVNITLTASQYTISAVFSNSLNNMTYSRSINGSLTPGMNYISNSGIIAVVNNPGSNETLTNLDLLLHNVIVDISIQDNKTFIIKVKKPIRCAVDDNELLISTDNPYANYVDSFISDTDSTYPNAVRYINGIAPNNGNIQIDGIGSVSVLVSNQE